MGFFLIPVGYRVEVVGAVIGVAVLDGCPHGLCEGDGGVEMEAVDAGALSGQLAAYDGRAVELEGEWESKGPGSEEVIF